MSALFSAGATKIAHRHFEMGKKDSPVMGAGFSVSLGAIKEAADFRSRKGTASFKDFIWDIAGALTGAAIIGLTL